MGKVFCFLKGSMVDCPDGTVQDCNMKRVTTCKLDEANLKEKTSGRKPWDKKEEEEGASFCFCKGEIVDCLPGVVLDCNNKRTSKCPLIQEEEDEAVRQTKAFEQAMQAHKAHRERKGDKALKPKQVKADKEFCFCKGELVDCPSSVVQDCNMKRISKCPLPEKNAAAEKATVQKKEGLAFCFCKGEVVDCLPGVVLDCNNKRTTKCPLIQEEEDAAERQTKAFEQAMKAHKAHRERMGKKASEPKEVKRDREFCFCVGELVDCPSATVQDCNFKKAKTCKLRE